jgi:hypothetical protein
LSAGLVLGPNGTLRSASLAMERPLGQRPADFAAGEARVYSLTLCKPNLLRARFIGYHRREDDPAKTGGRGFG